jgi:hypothetical protein
MAERGPTSTVEIYKHWKCDTTSCTNYGYHCFIDKADGKHYKLDATNVTRWGKAIKAGNASIDRPTNALRGYLM